MGEKRIKRWKGGMDAGKTARYLHDMAAEGLRLEKVGYLFYIFREDAPADLLYSVQKFKDLLSEEELEAYAGAGWQVVDHLEQEYVFVKERDTWAEDTIDQQAVAEEIDREMERAKEIYRGEAIVLLAMIGIFSLLFFLQFGREMFSEGMGRDMLISLGPSLLIAFFGGGLALCRLRKKRERIQAGGILEKDTNWRRQRKINAIGWLIVVLLLGGAIYYGMGWNETIYDLPQEISYAELPAVRLEKLEENELIRMGKSLAEQQEDVKNIYGSSNIWYTYDNSVRDYGNLIFMKEIRTWQDMRDTEKNTEIELTTAYYDFLCQILAKKQYKESLKQEEELYGRFDDSDMRKVIETPGGAFDEAHICQKDYTDESVIHVLCRQGRQVMELDYNGQTDAEYILAEVEKVFEAQN